MHRIPLKIVTESCIAHVGLLASFLGKKVSTNLGAIQYKKYKNSNLIYNRPRSIFSRPFFPQINLRDKIIGSIFANNTHQKTNLIVNFDR
jgi:hypothetical protein